MCTYDLWALLLLGEFLLFPTEGLVLDTVHMTTISAQWIDFTALGPPSAYIIIHAFYIDV